MTELELLQELNVHEYKLYKLIELWKDDWKTGTPHESYVYEKIGMPRATFFRGLKSLKEKGLV